jgi:hypothetical protein
MSHLWLQANIGSYQQLVVNRPDDYCVNAAVCKEPQIVHYTSKGYPAVHG